MIMIMTHIKILVLGIKTTKTYESHGIMKIQIYFAQLVKNNIN